MSTRLYEVQDSPVPVYEAAVAGEVGKHVSEPGRDVEGSSARLDVALEEAHGSAQGTQPVVMLSR